jgi:hypothetical protein
MALMPFLALVLLFTTSYHWSWYLMVPSWEACGPEPGKSSRHGRHGAAVGIVNASGPQRP